jgi:hypothetical protein
VVGVCGANALIDGPYKPGPGPSPVLGSNVAASHPDSHPGSPQVVRGLAQTHVSSRSRSRPRQRFGLSKGFRSESGDLSMDRWWSWAMKEKLQHLAT